MDNLNDIGLVKLKSNVIKKIDGGRWGWGGWLVVAAEEITDVITSNGQNLVDAYNNGRKAAG